MASGDRRLIAITGANGTIGSACVEYALSHGYRVRCIVRRQSAFGTITALPSIQPHLSCLSHAVVPDNAAIGAYDDALAGAHYVVHIAGVWPLPTLHPDDEIYHPFMRSMKNILESAEKSKSVRRIVFTQAGAGLVDPAEGDTLGTRMDRVLDEHTQPHPSVLAYVPPLPSPHHAYSAAKAQSMAHLTSLSHASPRLPFSIVQVIPGTVIGPSESVHTRPAALAAMDRQSRALLFDDATPRYAFGFVHAQDCAAVHIEALDETKVPEESLPPFFIAAHTEDEGTCGDEMWAQAVGVVEREFSEEIGKGVFKVGRGRVPVNMPYRADSRRTEEMLLDGRRMRGLDECVREVGRWYLGLEEAG